MDLKKYSSMFFILPPVIVYGVARQLRGRDIPSLGRAQRTSRLRKGSPEAQLFCRRARPPYYRVHDGGWRSPHTECMLRRK